MKQVYLEKYLHRALIKEAEKIEPGPDLVPKIKARIRTQRKRGGIVLFGTKLFDRLLPGEPGWKKAVAGTLCGALLVGGLTFGVSPQARAWAKESVISPAISITYKVVHTEEGYSISSEKVKEIETGSIALKEAPVCPEFSTAAEAGAHVGFPVRLPEYLPEGYQMVSMSGDKWKTTGKGFVHILYQVPGESPGRLSLMITDEPGFLRGGDAVKEVKLGGKTAYWSEFPIIGLPAADGKEPTVSAGHALKWEDSGLVYDLHESSGQLTLEEMLKIAGSIKLG